MSKGSNPKRDVEYNHLKDDFKKVHLKDDFKKEHRYSDREDEVGEKMNKQRTARGEKKRNKHKD